MLHIGICDGNHIHREQLHKVLATLLFDTTDIRVTQFPTGQQVVDALKNGTFHVDILFLEIALPDMNGLRVASALRAANFQADIIFLTELERYVFDGYAYHAYDYLIKPISAKKIGVCIQRYVREKIKNRETYLTIASKGNTERINLWKVRYFESRQRKVAALLDDYEVEFYQKVGDLFEIIRDSGFIRVHQSYLVNAAMISSMNSHEVALVDGTTIPVSKRYLTEVRDYLMQSSVAGG